ncbi:lycopene cyclase domain-containing protein [Georgenia faecalis]|uniref:Lycopene cyclase domain-containing protein n=1 Tax=Georgenia faecalis TaxID=2483799 RepID=A0ABV9D5C0_9MICO|nr:lycopene cyclase domain-containing protein [Georgenia faecalis]
MTYTLVNAPFLALCVAAVAVCARRRPGRLRPGAVVVTVAVLVVLTAVFDNVMIAAGLFDYASEGRSGLAVGRAPVEDFAYPVAGALALPALWHLLGRRATATAPSETAGVTR